MPVKKKPHVSRTIVTRARAVLAFAEQRAGAALAARPAKARRVVTMLSSCFRGSSITSIRPRSPGGGDSHWRTWKVTARGSAATWSGLRDFQKATRVTCLGRGPMAALEEKR